VNRFLHRIINRLRAGYPRGIPPTDYIPLLALLSRRLTNDEVKTVAKERMDRGEFDSVDIGVAITQIHRRIALTRRRSEGPGAARGQRGGRLTTHPIARRTDNDAALPTRPGRPAGAVAAADPGSGFGSVLKIRHEYEKESPAIKLRHRHRRR
jgi:hypothetical protein